jgi:sulfur-carrier protein adenylyltransferase/sulfurtransferase
MSIPDISVQELQALKESNADFVLIDVRDQWEHDICNLGGRLIPYRELPLRINEIEKDKQVIVHCQMGGRSSRAVAYLLEQGYTQVFNLRGGIKAWANEIDPTMKQY